MAELKHTEDSSASGVCKNVNNHIREKLVELIVQGNIMAFGRSESFAEIIADHLIANGVTVQTEEEKWNALNEAFDLGVDCVLHDHFGLSWSDAAELRKEVKRLQEATKWIPVTERLPKDGDIVLCYMEFGEQRMARWDESENCWAGQLIDYHKEQVTHWMPLPEAPKGE